MKQFYKILVFLLFHISISIIADVYSLRWKEVEGNNGYQVQVKNKEDKIFMSRDVDTNKIDLDIPAGDYLYRISTLNKFHKPSKWSDWEPLSESVTDFKYIYSLEWDTIQGSHGYRIEIQDASGKIVREEKVNGNQTDIKLPVGKYKYRISALNKFEKPSNWSEWETFSNLQETTLAQKDYGWKLYVPGYPQIKNHQIVKGNLIIAWFLLLAVADYKEWRAGNQLASNPLNDPNYLTALALAGSPELSIYLRENRAQDKREYNSHQQNQSYIAAIALLSYSYYIWDAKKGNAVKVSFKLNSDRLSRIQTTGFPNPLHNPYFEFSFLLDF
ncbi:MAG: hypothetical protein H7A23_25300 [Leptospiraceae bacterium]|nr:hypothetical protein [Leptospiraceae bacterium]